MNGAEFVSRHLHPDDDLTSFNSGEPSLDEWLRRSALHAEAIRSGRTWIWTHAGSVVGYFTLAGHIIDRQSLPHQVGRGSPDRIPAVLLARLALHRDLHGHGMGGALLADASQRIVAATDVVAARFVVVDAINDAAASFYAHFGYRAIPGTRRLVRKISDLANDLRAD